MKAVDILDLDNGEDFSHAHSSLDDKVNKRIVSCYQRTQIKVAEKIMKEDQKSAADIEKENKIIGRVVEKPPLQRFE